MEHWGLFAINVKGEEGLPQKIVMPFLFIRGLTI